MTQKELNRQVARQLGEDVRQIRRIGFSIVDPCDANFDPPPCRRPQTVDWDEVDRRRLAF